MIIWEGKENKEISDATDLLYWLFFPVDIHVVFKDKIDVVYDTTMRTKEVYGCFTAPNTIVINSKLSKKKILRVFLHEVSHLYSYLTNTPEFMSYDVNLPWAKRKEELKACTEANLFQELFRWWKTSRAAKWRREKNFAKAIDKWYAYQRSRKNGI